MFVSRIKCVFAGDDAVGKTCLIFRKACGKFCESYIKPDCGFHSIFVDVGEDTYELCIIESQDQGILEILREIIYPVIRVFVLCFAVDLRGSFNNVTKKWVPDIRALCPTVPILLVGCRTDVRARFSMSTTTYPEGKDLARQIGALAYMECSAYDNTGVDEVFTRVAQIAADGKKRKSPPNDVKGVARSLHSKIQVHKNTAIAHRNPTPLDNT